MIFEDDVVDDDQKGNNETKPDLEVCPSEWNEVCLIIMMIPMIISSLERLPHTIVEYSQYLLTVRMIYC